MAEQSLYKRFQDKVFGLLTNPLVTALAAVIAGLSLIGVATNWSALFQEGEIYPIKHMVDGYVVPALMLLSIGMAGLIYLALCAVISPFRWMNNRRAYGVLEKFHRWISRKYPSESQKVSSWLDEYHGELENTDIRQEGKE